jgi:hypothetical protein
VKRLFGCPESMLSVAIDKAKVYDANTCPPFHFCLLYFSKVGAFIIFKKKIKIQLNDNQCFTIKNLFHFFEKIMAGRDISTAAGHH